MKKNKRKDSITTLIGPDVRIEGSVEFQGTIRVDGQITGKIRTDNGKVIVGEKAIIHADISVDEAIIMGEVTGTIETREKIEVYPPGCITGDIRSPLISIASGVVIDGTCAVGRRETFSLPPDADEAS
jgi:cytoskeletal protein CcmA (bactofilin family)